MKRGLLAAFSRLLERDFDHLLFAHGAPWVGGGREALPAFVEARTEGVGVELVPPEAGGLPF
ncbi:MAG: hypothetical protein M1325_01900 [Actinobacteria bacterium]|nr:hypothetical protein [Actinomycetota bacterium]